MRYMIELIEHNGVNGANRVEPFAGRTFEKDELFFPDFSEEELRNEMISVEGRTFTYSHTIKLPEQTNYLYRQKVQTEPSDWAKANGHA